jgi:hypothetical protein
LVLPLASLEMITSTPSCRTVLVHTVTHFEP